MLSDDFTRIENDHSSSMIMTVIVVHKNLIRDHRSDNAALAVETCLPPPTVITDKTTIYKTPKLYYMHIFHTG